MDGSVSLEDPAPGPALDDLVARVVSARGQKLTRADTLPPDAYTSDAFFKLEVEKIFRREWLAVGHMAQLAEVGDYFTIDLLGEMLVVVRAADRVRVLSRICLHRWAPLVNGTGNARLFSCPFHKWAYGLDGRLLGAPLMEGVEFEPGGCTLPEFRSEVVDGFIYMTFNADAPPLAPTLAGLSARIARFNVADLVESFVLEYEVGFNWKIVVETFMECYHHIAAHPETFERMFPARLSYVEDGDAAWTIGHSPARPEVPDSEIAAGFPLLGELTATDRHEFSLYLVYPYHLFALLPDRAGWFCLQPDGPDRTRIQTRFLVRPEAKDLPDYAEKAAAERDFFIQVNSEDIAVNEMQQKGAATRSATFGRLCDLEKAAWQLAEYVRGRVAP
jgi:phenylpropionate dioxygenase-like ring-hydroxylating dioxygenase large terminal subunit